MRKVGSLNLTECPVSFDHNAITPQILCPDLNSVFPKCGNAPNTQTGMSWHCGGL